MLRYSLPFILSAVVWAGDDTVKTGYVYCSQGDQNGHASVYLNTCGNRPALRAECGEKVTALGREGRWLQIVTSHGFRRYIHADAVSQEQDRFVAFDVSSVPELEAPNCGVVGPRADVKQPRLISQAWPEYSEEARRKHIEGVVVLSLTVGTDGLPHDIKVEKSLGYELDENAVRAVEKYRFDPGQRDGQPADMPIHVEVSFHLYGQKP